MKVVEVNAAAYGSTGKIMWGIADSLEKFQFEVYTFSSCHSSQSNVRKNHIFIDNKFLFQLHRVIGFITGNETSYSIVATNRLIKFLKQQKPNILHLHNIHGWYLNSKKIFKYIKRQNIKVVWTLHDCWSFTGHCPHFTMVKCDKWKTDCYNCSQYRVYPKSLFDNSKKMYRRKKKWFTGVKNLTIVTPSEWLAGLVKQSYLKEYPVQVINNGIDLDVFKPTESNFREKYNIGDKYIILGVAFGWGKRKGLDLFIELAKRLDCEKYQIVLVGTDNKVDKQLPKNIISIHRTQNQTELAEIYTAADLFVNPTREENFPTVNIEALACGTPIVTFRTGGSPEIIDDTCGVVVDEGDIDGLEREILRIENENPFSTEVCLSRAARFDQKDKFAEYIKLYQEKELSHESRFCF